MLRRKSKMQNLKNRELGAQNATALLTYLKRLAPQQLKLRTQVFTKKILLSAKNKSATFFYIKKTS
jgi:hypothetical protein